MIAAVRCAFFLLVVRPLIWVVIGLHVRHRERLPTQGPAIVVANHNSHLDTLILIALFSLKQLPQLRPVAAADYFLRNRWVAWFAQNIIGIIPIRRAGIRRTENPLQACTDALHDGQVLILFPEGTRGEPETLAAFKSGVARLAEAHPDVPVYPVFMHGVGKVLPRGSWLPVPLFCDVFVGRPLYWSDNRKVFVERIATAITSLGEEGAFPAWE